MSRILCAALCVGLWLAPGCPASGAPPQAPSQAPAASAMKEKSICPVMLEEVEDTSEAAYSDYKGKRYYFCCPACKPKFDKNPRKYIRALERQSAAQGGKKRA